MIHKCMPTAPLLVTCHLLPIILCLLLLSGCARAPTATPSAIAPTQTAYTHRHTATHGDGHPDGYAGAHLHTHPHSNPNAAARRKPDRL